MGAMSTGSGMADSLALLQVRIRVPPRQLHPLHDPHSAVGTDAAASVEALEGEDPFTELR